MAGGIFTDRPFEANPKCIIFSGVLMALYYWIAPKPNLFVYPVIFVVAYVAMAWYDYAYDCSSPLYSGYLGPAAVLDSIFKPQRRTLPEPEQERVYRRYVYLFHLLAVFPVLFYVGYYGPKTDRRIYSVLLYIAILGAGYHLMKLVFINY